MDNIIQEGDQVLIKRGKNIKPLQVRKSRTVWMDKIKFQLDGAVGQTYGSMFEVKNERLIKVSHSLLEEETAEEGDESGTGPTASDNRELQDTSENQALCRDDIEALKSEGAGGELIIDQLIEHSATFKHKTEYSQQKYIKKKKRKHLAVFTILKPSTRLIAEMYLSRGPSKICNMRIDSLAQILTYSNVRAGSKVLLVESCQGLVLAALMERLAGQGKIIQIFTGTAPQRSALECYNFPKNYSETVAAFPIDLVNTLSVQEKQLATQVKSLEVPELDHCESSAKEISKINVEVCCPEKNMEAGNSASGDDVMEVAERDNETAAGTPEATSSQSLSEKQDLEGEEKGTLKRKKKDAAERKVHQEWKAKQIAGARAIIEAADMDCLIVTCKFHPTPIVMKLINYLANSRPFVVYCQYKEPLMDCYHHLRSIRQGVVHVNLTETWLRDYQILPDRTHPAINMSGTGGYLLTGTKVEI